MNLNITGHHLEVTDSIREYVTSKLDKVIRHFEHVTAVHVILSVAKLRQKAEITVHVRGKDIFVESEEEDLYAAIDSMIDKLDRQVVKHKEKSADHSRDAIKHQPTAEL